MGRCCSREPADQPLVFCHWRRLQPNAVGPPESWPRLRAAGAVSAVAQASGMRGTHFASPSFSVSNPDPTPDERNQTPETKKKRGERGLSIFLFMNAATSAPAPNFTPLSPLYLESCPKKKKNPPGQHRGGRRWPSATGSMWQLWEVQRRCTNVRIKRGIYAYSRRRGSKIHTRLVDRVWRDIKGRGTVNGLGAVDGHASACCAGRWATASARLVPLKT